MNIKFFDKKLEHFIQTFEKPTIAKVLRTIDLLERFGHELGMPHSKKIDRRLFELRIRGQEEIRIFYTFFSNDVILLHGFMKKSQRIPERELFVARQKLQALDRV